MYPNSRYVGFLKPTFCARASSVKFLLSFTSSSTSRVPSTFSTGEQVSHIYETRSPINSKIYYRIIHVSKNETQIIPNDVSKIPVQNLCSSSRAFSDKGRFCNNSEIVTLSSKRLSVKNKAKLF